MPGKKRDGLTPLDIEVLLAYAECDKSISAVQDKLYMCTSSIYHHLKNVEHDTGLNPIRFNDLVKLVQMFGGENDGEA